MSKKINAHIAKVSFAALKKEAERRNTTSPDLIENEIDRVGDITKEMASSLHVSDLHKGRATVGMKDETRKLFREASENLGVSMVEVLSLFVMVVTNNGEVRKALGLEGANEPGNTPDRKPEVTCTDSAPQQDGHSSSPAPNLSDKISSNFVTPSRSRHEIERKKAERRGLAHRNIADMPFHEIEKLAETGHRRAREIVENRKSIIEYQQRLKEEAKLKEEMKKNRTDGKEAANRHDDILTIIRQEAERIKVQETRQESSRKAPEQKARTIVRYVLDKDLQVEENELSGIRDRLDTLVGTLSAVKPRGHATSYQAINTSIRDINSSLTELNRYVSMRRKLYMEQERRRVVAENQKKAS